MTEIVQTLIWPITTLVIIFLLRKPLIGLLEAAKRVKYKDIEVEFQKDIQKLQAQADVCIPNTNNEKNNAKNISVDLYELAKISPHAAVIEAWKSLEDTTRKVLTTLGYTIDADNSAPYKVLQDILIEDSIINERWGKMFNDLRTLRNKIAHAPDFSISDSEATQYIELSIKLGNYLKTTLTNNSEPVHKQESTYEH